MARWYYSLKGKAEGPVGEEHLLEGLKAGRLTLVDLVFREGDAAWCTLGEIPRFREAFQALPPPVLAPAPVAPALAESLDSSESLSGSSSSPGSHHERVGMPAWVVLRKKASGSFEQLGPYTAEQLETMLAAGEVEYTQYAWKTGYKRWVRIGNLPEFDRRKRDRNNDDVNQIVPLPEEGNAVPALSREELMENVVRMDRLASALSATESVPEEASGVDLVSGENYQPLAQMRAPSHSLSQSYARAATEEAQAPEKNEESVRMAPLFSSVAQVAAKEEPRAEDRAPARPPVAEHAPRSQEVTSAAHESAVMATAEPEAVAGPGPVVSPAPPSVSRKKIGVRSARPGGRVLRLFFAGIAAGVFVVVALQILNMNQKSQMAEAEKAPAPPAPAEPIPGIIREGANGAEAPIAPSAEGEGGTIASAVADPNLSSGNGSAANLESKFDPSAQAAPAGLSGSSAETTPPSAPAAAQKAPGAAKVAPAASAKSQLLSGISPVAPGRGTTTQLEILPLGMSSATPLLVFQTDAGVGELILVTIKARTGEVLKVPSYERTVSLVRTAGEVASLDLSRLGLPQGAYHIEVASGSLKRAADIFLGPRDASFEAELEKHLKSIAQKQQAERKALYYTAKRFEGLAKDLGESYQKYRMQQGKWRAFYSGWKKQVLQASEPAAALKVSAEDGALAYPDEAKDLRAAIDQLVEQSRVLDKAIEQQRQVASQKPLGIVRDFNRIKERAAQLTGRPD